MSYDKIIGVVEPALTQYRLPKYAAHYHIIYLDGMSKWSGNQFNVLLIRIQIISFGFIEWNVTPTKNNSFNCFFFNILSYYFIKKQLFRI